MRDFRTRSLLILLIMLISATAFLPAEEVRKNPNIASLSMLADDGGRVAWSFDGKRIAFDRRMQDGYFDLFITDVADGKVTSLTDGAQGAPQGNNGNPAWHPSGKYILFQAEDTTLGGVGKGVIAKYATSPGIGLNNNLWIAAADGSSFWQLTHVQQRLGTLHPHFSRDGKKVVWSEIISPSAKSIGNWAIKLADFAVTDEVPTLANVQTLTPGDMQLYEMHGFSPDGAKLLFSGVKKGGFYWDFEIFTYDLATKQLDRLTDDNEWDEHAHYTPDGKFILWASSNGLQQNKFDTLAKMLFSKLHLELWVMKADGSGKRRLTSFSVPGSQEAGVVGEIGHIGDFDFAPDGKRLAIKSRGDSNKERVLVLELSQAAFESPVVIKNYKAEKGPYEVAAKNYEWYDKNRKRDVPAKIYYPAKGPQNGPYPIIIFSHGAGGSREGYAYFGNHVASWGYVCVHLQHKGSDEGVWRDKADPLGEIRKCASNPDNAINRPRDVSFAVDTLTDMNVNDADWVGLLDLNRIGMAGHSFGAYTTLAVSGMVFSFGKRDLTLGDPRIRASVSMSGQAPRERDASKVFGAIRIPILHMTGTEDTSPINDTTPQDRRVPYDNISLADQYLVTFDGGDHMVFSGRGNMKPRSTDSLYQSLILQGSLAFFDCYLMSDAIAREWLVAGGYKDALENSAVYEMKLK